MQFGMKHDDAKAMKCLGACKGGQDQSRINLELSRHLSVTYTTAWSPGHLDLEDFQARAVSMVEVGVSIEE